MCICCYLGLKPGAAANIVLCELESTAQLIGGVLYRGYGGDTRHLGPKPLALHPKPYIMGVIQGDTMNPLMMIRRHLMDPVALFVKAEGHDEDKITSKRWRLIWNVSEPDRLIDCLHHQEQDHMDVLFHQSEAGAASPLATGVGHNDEGLERTHRDLQYLLDQSSSGEIHCFDASGWDFGYHKHRLVSCCT